MARYLCDFYVYASPQKLAAKYVNAVLTQAEAQASAEGLRKLHGAQYVCGVNKGATSGPPRAPIKSPAVSAAPAVPCWVVAGSLMFQQKQTQPQQKPRPLISKGAAPQLSPLAPLISTSFLRPQLVAGSDLSQSTLENRLPRSGMELFDPHMPAYARHINLAGAEGVQPMFKWKTPSKQERDRAVEARLHGVGLGAMPYVVKKWFPEITEDEWTAAESGQYAGASTSELLAKANAAEAQWQAGIKQYKAEGACDATQPGRLAGALRAYLIANGGNEDNLGDEDDTFGELECKEWMKVFNKQPDLAAAKAAIQVFQGGMGKAVANYGWKVITLADICGTSVKLPVCKPAAGPPPPPKPECDDKTPCPSGYKCVSGKCVKQVAEEPKKSNWLWLLALGAGGLGIAAAAGAFPKAPKDLPKREAERLMENRRGRKRSKRR